MTKEIKYDGSEQEMFELGLITNDGVVVTNKRNQFNMYMKEVERRQKYRENKTLIEQGIVDKNGKILDEKALSAYEKKEEAKRDAVMRQKETERINKPTIFSRAAQKVKALFRKKRVPNTNSGMSR